MAEQPDSIIEFHEISKRFRAVRALDDVTFSIPKGEVHALVGENGAGKSTLIRVCGGVYPPTAGTIRFKGEEIQFRSVEDSIAAGVSIVHQEIPICPHLTASENIWLGRPLPKRAGLVNWRETNRRTRELFGRLGVDINPNAIARNLTIAQQQIVVIAQALALESDLLIMDEPTSALNKEETDHLFSIIRQLRDDGLSIIYVSHRLEEVFDIADRISALRDGRYINTVAKRDTTPNQVVNMMVGREVTNLFPKVVSKPSKEPLLSLRNASVPRRFEDVSLDLHGGEVLGLVGLQGSGTSDVLRTIYGMHPDMAGELWVRGEQVNFKSSADAIKQGIGYVPADRQAEGLFASMNVRDNGGLLLMKVLSRGLGWIPMKKLDARIHQLVQAYGIRTASIRSPISSLSGGNQQKVVISRSLSTQPLIVLLDDPTRGIDVGAKAEVHEILNVLTSEGCGVILVSSELPEVMAMSDRVVVMYRGQIRAELSQAEADHELVMGLATGADTANAHADGIVEAVPA